MRFAKNEHDKKFEVQFSGQRAICDCCNSEVIGRYGKIRPKHWYHKSSKDCDSWYEPITKWHLEWQDNFPKENQEIKLFDEYQNVMHRADVQLDNGLILEVQYSPIKIDEIEQREIFYSKNGGLIWILNGENLLKNCHIKYRFECKEHTIRISIPEYVENVEYFSFDYIRDELLQSNSFKRLESSNVFKEREIQNGSNLIYHFDKGIDFNTEINRIKEDAFIATEKHYLINAIEIWNKFEFNYTSIPNDRFVNVKLIRSYWRQFIDEMRSPVFIDKIKGLDEKYLYYYQRNQIIEKKKFLLNIKHGKY